MLYSCNDMLFLQKLTACKSEILEDTDTKFGIVDNVGHAKSSSKRPDEGLRRHLRPKSRDTYKVWVNITNNSSTIRDRWKVLTDHSQEARAQLFSETISSARRVSLHQ